ncbi:MAG: hypothetical protein JNK82_05090 [Myxococcaceae bacterium]|nr:hypothetical protein [Myxococcaceae bacterium]
MSLGPRAAVPVVVFRKKADVAPLLDLETLLARGQSLVELTRQVPLPRPSGLEAFSLA